MDLKGLIKETICLLVVMLVLTAGTLWAQTTLNLSDNSLTTATGAYQSAVHAYPYKWDITKGDVTIEGLINLGGIQAYVNTWDPDLGDADDFFGLWGQIGLSKEPVFNSSDGVWFVTVEWLGGGDDSLTEIREILHMQEEPGTQPMPKLYTEPRTIAGGDGDDTLTFKLQIHSTGSTTGWTKLWIHGVLVEGDMWSVFDPDSLDYTGEDLSNTHVLIGVMSGNNPNNPAHTFYWSNLTVTGYPAFYSEVWVDSAWVGTAPGTEVEPGKYFGFNAFAEIQDGVDAVADGGTVHVAAGTYAEDVQISKGLTLTTAGKSGATIDGGIWIKDLHTFTNAITVENFTIENGISIDANHDYGIKISGDIGLADLAVVDMHIVNNTLVNCGKTDDVTTEMWYNAAIFYDVNHFGALGSRYDTYFPGTGEISHNTIVNNLGDPNQRTQLGIGVRSGRNMEINYSDISGNVAEGIHHWGPVNTASTGNYEIDHNTIDLSGWMGDPIGNNPRGIWSYAPQSSVSYNTIISKWIGMVLTYWDDTYWGGSTAGPNYGLTVSQNVIHPPVKGAMSVGLRISGNNSQIMDNEIYGATDNVSGYGAGLMFEGWGHPEWGERTECAHNTFEGNYIHDNYDGIFTWDPPYNKAFDNVFHNNSVENNTNYGLYNGNDTTTVDASGNWWGTNTPAGVAGEVSDSVDYTPWLHDGTDQSGNPGFQPDLSYLHVDDNSPQTGTAEYIEEGIGMVTGSTVQVEAGTYIEQVYITKSLDLIGVGSKPVIEAPPAATRTTYNIPESGRTFDPIIFADGGAGVVDVTVDNFEIDGNDDGGTNTFCGILLRNTDPGMISNNDLHSLRGTGQETQGILMYGANTDVTVSGNTVTDFSRNGITANVDAQAAISGNTVTGDGPLPLGNWAQNGIQIGFGASGTITGNTITGCSILDPGWAASGILAYQPTGTIQINGNTTTENEVNIYLGDCSANIEGNTINATATGTGQTYFYGIIGDPGETKAPKPSVFGDLDGVSKPMSGTKVTYTVTCTDNIVESDGSAGGTGIGIYAGMYGTYDIDFTATGNTVRYWQWGFELYEYTPNNLISAEIHYNNIEGNTDNGIYNYLTETFDATNNWWGSVDGPQDLVGSDEAKLDECYDVSTIKNTVAEISGTLGNDVTEYVEYCPWLGGNAGFDAEIYAGCNDPCDDFCLDFKLSGTDVRFFHFEYPLPACIDLVSSSGTHGDLVVWETVMFGDVLHIDGSFDPNFTGANVKIGEICFTHDGGCQNDVQTLTCSYREVRNGAGDTVHVSPGLAIINLDNTAPTKDHPGNILPCYSAPDDPDWTCWNLNFYKGAEEWQCDLLRATIQIYKASGCGLGDLVFTNDFFTTPISGDYNICYPTNQTERDAIWAATHTAHGDGIYYVELTVWDNCCNFDSNCAAFTFCIDTETDNYMTCLDARPAHNHICLEWNYNFDATNAVELKILRSPYRPANYPEYGDPPPVPTGHDDATWYMLYEGTDTYPCNQTTWYNDDGTGCNGGGTDFDHTTRDIYWYAGFTCDAAGNWSAPNMTLGTGADRMTSYWLGDVTDIGGGGDPDGKVLGTAGDVHRLTVVYGSSPATDHEVDYGPETQDHGIGRGIPIPDDVINYKDLLPFSFNYNIVGPSGDCDTWPLLPGTNPPRQLNKNVDEIAAVWLEQIESTHPEGITFALMLTNPGDATHLFHSRISYDSDVLSLVEVRHGELGVSEGFAEFFRTPITGEGLVDADLAALGPEGYLIGSGAVAYLDFIYEVSGMASVVRLEEAILYDGEGNEIELSPTDVEVENQGASIPTEFALHQNHPNPFNPMTTIKYDLPQATYVKLVVYNVRGQKVATLVDGMVEAGRQQVMWNAKDISSGIYFYKITAGNFTKMNKMILLK